MKFWYLCTYYVIPVYHLIDHGLQPALRQPRPPSPPIRTPPAAAAAAEDPPADKAASPVKEKSAKSGRGAENQMIVSMMIVIELECLVSKQWQGQIRGFQPGQPAGCSLKKFIGSKYIQEYQVI